MGQSRLDTLQAAFLLAKMNLIDGWNEARRANAKFYRERLHDVVRTPDEKPYEKAVYQTFVIQADRRDELQTFLKDRGIDTKVHYPIPIHQQKAAAYLGYNEGSFPVAERQVRHILSLPVYPELTAEQKEHVVRSIRDFYGAA